MSPVALLLVFVSAGLHATWNFLAKRAEDQVSFMFLLMATTPLVFLGPMIWMGLHGYSFGPWWVWVVSGFMQAAYCHLMGRGYEYGDLSQVYPLARGLAPGLIAVLAWVLLGEKLSLPGIAGIVAIIAGGLLLHTDHHTSLFNGNSLRALWQPGSRLALLASVAIAGYHLADKYGAVHASTPLSYLCAMHVFLILFLGALTMTNRRPAHVAAEWRRNWKLALVGMVFCFAAYLLVVTAMKLAPVAYVASLRNVGILVGVFYGVAALKEAGLGWRLAGAGLMLAGIAVVALFG